ncbi:dihydrofolate reductase family protein [Actinomadura graeca]|uniref:Dihydrofolate reductase family protein n=1 Tax=Actinomadura graeca TaxID=2750812 RepID=A0ABX8R4J1_9ACTN|nr:dihydrofolate reductase family protein [Actinomadura graeca]QXJ25481.1 dihydrofolate reductase family protein [Actinomadura graeca]
MRALVYYVGISLDGYIAGPGGEIDFYPVSDQMMRWITESYPETLPTHIRSKLGLEDAPNRRFDTLVMGLGTYRPALDIGVTSPYAHVRQYVASTTLPEIADPAVTLVRDPLGLVRSLKAADGDGDIWLAGGGRLAASLLPEIDELIIKTYPVVAGAGVPVFAGGFGPAPFTPTAREEFDNGTQVTWLARTG